MARFLVYSDLHYELGGKFTLPDCPRGEVDGVILAGDISKGAYAMRRAKAIADKLDAPAILVAGNHEFCGGVLEQVIEELRSLSDERVTFLEGNGKVIAGARVLGTTLWTDFNLNPELRQLALRGMPRFMSDYSEIRRRVEGGTKYIDTDFILKTHRRQIKWLGDALARKFDGPTVVVTHTAPSSRSIVSHKSTQIVSAGFASDLVSFICEHKIDVWVHGHIHDTVDYRIHNTRVVSNPYGYEGFEPNYDFDPEFIVKV